MIPLLLTVLKPVLVKTLNQSLNIFLPVATTRISKIIRGSFGVSSALLLVAQIGNHAGLFPEWIIDYIKVVDTKTASIILLFAFLYMHKTRILVFILNIIDCIRKRKLYRANRKLENIKCENIIAKKESETIDLQIKNLELKIENRKKLILLHKRIKCGGCKSCLEAKKLIKQQQDNKDNNKE